MFSLLSYISMSLGIGNKKTSRQNYFNIYLLSSRCRPFHLDIEKKTGTSPLFLVLHVIGSEDSVEHETQVEHYNV